MEFEYWVEFYIYPRRGDPNEEIDQGLEDSVINMINKW